MTDREMKTVQADKLFDLHLLKKAPNERREELLETQILRAESGMTAEEISHVMERVRKAKI